MVKVAEVMLVNSKHYQIILRHPWTNIKPPTLANPGILYSWGGISKLCALGEKIFFGMVLGMGLRFSKNYRKQVDLTP